MANSQAFDPRMAAEERLMPSNMHDDNTASLSMQLTSMCCGGRRPALDDVRVTSAAK